MTAPGTRVGVWCAADADRFGEALRARIVAAELRRRLPGAEVRIASPLGDLHPTRFDDGLRSEALGAFGARRAAEAAAGLDAVVVTGEVLPEPDAARAGVHYDLQPAVLAALAPSGFAIEGPGAGGPPLVWLGVGLRADLAPAEVERLRAALAGWGWIAARDEPSAAALSQVAPAGTVAVSGDPLMLACRHVDADVRRKRLAQLALTGAHPSPGAAVAVLLGPGSSPRAAEVGRAVSAVLAGRAGLSAVAGDVGPGAVARNAGRAALAHLPAGSADLGRAGSADLVAVIAAAAALVTDDPAAAAVAAGAGVPAIPAAHPDLAGALAAALDDPAGVPDPRRAAPALDAALDRVAALALRSGAGAPAAAAEESTLVEALALISRSHDEALRRAVVDLTRAQDALAEGEARAVERERLLAHLQSSYDEAAAAAARAGEVVQALLARAEAAERALRDEQARAASARDAHTAARASLESRLADVGRRLAGTQAELDARVAAYEARLAELAGEVEAREQRARAADAEADRMRADLAEIARTPAYRLISKVGGTPRHRP